MSEKIERAGQFIQALPHALALGMQLEDMEPGTAVISLPYSDKIVGILFFPKCLPMVVS